MTVPVDVARQDQKPPACGAGILAALMDCQCLCFPSRSGDAAATYDCDKSGRRYAPRCQCKGRGPSTIDSLVSTEPIVRTRPREYESLGLRQARLKTDWVTRIEADFMERGQRQWINQKGTVRQNELETGRAVS